MIGRRTWADNAVRFLGSLPATRWSTRLGNHMKHEQPSRPRVMQVFVFTGTWDETGDRRNCPGREHEADGAKPPAPVGFSVRE